MLEFITEKEEDHVLLKDERILIEKIQLEPMLIVLKTLKMHNHNIARSKPIERRHRKRSDTRLGCKVVMSIRRNEKKDWVVTRVIEELSIITTLQLLANDINFGL
ncbi:hypothetical protein IFM89_004916 [Coptis chinensis]|uniref:Uncharacterized protein n=1 Tax=Coptis chinensis TaxID=261450 RepID=A0A835LQY5_9MAGN|nr:hypothetical protein IFM89_004916 [Coptis chinensis]